MVRPIPSIALAITTISFFIRIIYPNSNTKYSKPYDSTRKENQLKIY